MDQYTQLAKIKQYVKTLFHSDATGHDFFHMQRVANIAKELALEENINPFICEVAGWIHDIGDQKLFANPQNALTEMNDFLHSIGIAKEELRQIRIASENVSFSQGRIPTTLEGKIVQDADRIDALGAIGIARTFAYGGAKGQLIHDEDVGKSTSIKHFYDKLFVLKDQMHTDTAKQVAEQRHQYMEEFVTQFFKEW